MTLLTFFSLADVDTKPAQVLLKNVLEKSSVKDFAIVHAMQSLIFNLKIQEAALANNIELCVRLLAQSRYFWAFSVLIRRPELSLQLLESFNSNIDRYEWSNRYLIALFAILKYCKNKGLITSELSVTHNGFPQLPINLIFCRQWESGQSNQSRTSSYR
jgi:hypothetical protein